MRGDEPKVAAWLAEEVCPVELHDEQFREALFGALSQRADRTAVENWNSENTVIVYGNDGDRTGADREHAEVSMLALHLLSRRSSHINTLLLQAVFEVPDFHDLLGPPVDNLGGVTDDPRRTRHSRPDSLPSSGDSRLLPWPDLPSSPPPESSRRAWTTPHPIRKHRSRSSTRATRPTRWCCVRRCPSAWQRVSESTTSVGTVEFIGDEQFSTPIDVTTESTLLVDITSVNDDDYVADLTVESYVLTVAEGGEIAESYASDTELGPLEGLTLTATYMEGSLASLAPQPGTTVTAEQQQAIAELTDDDGGGVWGGIPEEPLGAGATWSAEVPVLGSEVVVNYELSALDGDAWTVRYEATADSDAVARVDVPESFDSATGTITISGTATGDATDPFVGANDGAIDMVITMSNPDGELLIDIELESHQTDEPA